MVDAGVDDGDHVIFREDTDPKHAISAPLRHTARMQSRNCSSKPTEK